MSAKPSLDSDPVFFDDGEGGWFFWDETWSRSFGPYKTESDARDALKLYGDSL